MAILELSKVHMYTFYYAVLEPTYGERIKLAHTDTDNFVIHIETEDLYKDLQRINSYMDFSDYPKTHCNYDHTNKKVLGKFKDEVNGNIITEFIGLEPQMHAFQKRANTKAKGVPKNVVKKEINFDLHKKNA